MWSKKKLLFNEGVAHFLVLIPTGDVMNEWLIGEIRRKYCSATWILEEGEQEEDDQMF